MASFIVFLLVAGIPFVIFGINALNAMREQRGIAAGIPRPKQAKEPRRFGGLFAQVAVAATEVAAQRGHVQQVD